MSGIIEKMQAEIDELKRKVAELEAEKSPTAYPKLDVVAIAKAFEATAKSMRKFRKRTRAEIVERAKRDVANTIDSLYESDGGFYEIEFVINAEKLTVVSLMWAAGKQVHRRGIAKCAPDDCFNVHIGKAIALRRALGEEVPDEYLNAPAPEGFEVGDIVIDSEDTHLYEYEVFVVNFDGTIDVKLISDSPYGSGPYLDCKSSWFKVIDDSARYE